MNRSIGLFLLNIAVAGYLFATGIMSFGNRGFGGANPEIRQAVEALFGRGDLSNFLVIVLAVLAIAAGVFILLRLFNIHIPMLDLLLVICAAVWVVFIIMIDIIAPINSSADFNFINWLRVFCPHLMVLSGILLSTNRFGGK
ncbi:MAG: hypothetical protein FWC36_04215 [Spirochaetes bacterium]|nr:hypothetical protein [Spirochaetota bacterium]